MESRFTVHKILSPPQFQIVLNLPKIKERKVSGEISTRKYLHPDTEDSTQMCCYVIYAAEMAKMADWCYDKLQILYGGLWPLVNSFLLCIYTVHTWPGVKLKIYIRYMF